MGNQDIIELIKQSRLREAVNLMQDRGFDAIHLSQKLSALKMDRISGAYSSESLNIRRSRIVNSMLSTLGVKPSVSNRPSTNIVVSQSSGIDKDLILPSLRKLKRRNPDLFEKGKSILEVIAKYNLEKELNPVYDKDGLRQSVIMGTIKDFISKCDDLKTQDGKSIEETVTKLLDGVPSYDNLQAAYKLAQGRGMNNAYINRALEARPNDLETRIEIAEKIEDFFGIL